MNNVTIRNGDTIQTVDGCLTLGYYDGTTVNCIETIYYFDENGNYGLSDTKKRRLTLSEIARMMTKVDTLKREFTVVYQGE